MQEVKDYEIKALKKQIFISNLKAWIIGVILIAEIAFISMYFAKMGFLDDSSIAKNRVAVIRFNKPVTEEFTTKVMEEMDKVRENEDYKSVLFIMSSPGGSPTASEELSEYLKEYQKDLNITMYVESIAASGGYYIASAVKPLIANKNAIVGSIGVIMPHYNFGELAKKVGVEEDYLAAGKFKKPISMLAKIDKENKDYITKNLLKPTYDNFIQAVADNRGLKKEQIIPFAEGKIFIANVPEIQNILVDEVSSLYRVKAMIRENLDKKDLDFVKINLEEEPPFLPMIKVDLGLDELREMIQLR
ncbi:Protease IV [hydrothermal vent metagenome]|uniref:Protease IV n=1 Tax=hydrothermal vent metagenome TaxID=652676 RepID=A0A1W1BY52_9ZZZZ